MESYSAYKHSGDHLIKKIPSHWELKRLKYCVKCNQQSLPENTSPDFHVNYIDIGNVNSNGDICEIQDLSFSEAPSRARRIVNKGDVLISMVRTYLRAITQITSDSPNLIASTGFAVLTPQGHFNQDFLFYACSSDDFIDRVVSNSKGVSYPSITSSELLSISICVPPESEQYAISRFLRLKISEIQTLISKKRILIDLLNEERTAIINQAVTKGLDLDVPMKDSGVEWLGRVPLSWTTCKMKHACTFIKDGTHGSFVRVENGYRLLSVRNIIDSEFQFREDDSRVSDTDFTEIAKSFKVTKDDIQLAIVGATLGKAAIVREMNEEFVTQRSLATFRANKARIIAAFLYYFIKGEKYQKFLWQNVGFSAQPGIYLGTLQNGHLCFPSIEEQEAIVEYIKFEEMRISELISKVQQEINLLSEYKTSLISEAVTGKIDVRDHIPTESPQPVN